MFYGDLSKSEIDETLITTCFSIQAFWIDLLLLFVQNEFGVMTNELIWARVAQVLDVSQNVALFWPLRAMFAHLDMGVGRGAYLKSSNLSPVRLTFLYSANFVLSKESPHFSIRLSRRDGYVRTSYSTNTSICSPHSPDVSVRLLLLRCLGDVETIGTTFFAPWVRCWCGLDAKEEGGARGPIRLGA